MTRPEDRGTLWREPWVAERPAIELAEHFAGWESDVQELTKVGHKAGRYRLILTGLVQGHREDIAVGGPRAKSPSFMRTGKGSTDRGRGGFTVVGFSCTHLTCLHRTPGARDDDPSSPRSWPGDRGKSTTRCAEARHDTSLGLVSSSYLAGPSFGYARELAVRIEGIRRSPVAIRQRSPKYM